MAWTADGLLLVCIIKRGSLLILPCMGRPLQLVTHGCSLDMGPAILLPLHPRISYMYVNDTACTILGRVTVACKIVSMYNEMN